MKNAGARRVCSFRGEAGEGADAGEKSGGKEKQVSLESLKACSTRRRSLPIAEKMPSVFFLSSSSLLL